MDYLSLVMSLNYTYLEFDFPTQYYWFYRGPLGTQSDEDTSSERHL